METGPNLESQLSSAAADADGAAMCAKDVPLLLQHREILSNGDFRNRQALAQLDDRGASLFLDHTSDGLTSLRSVLSAFDYFRLHSIRATLALTERLVNPPIWPYSERVSFV